MNNSIITGPMLAALTEAYVDAINKGAVPTIATAWQVQLHSNSHLHLVRSASHGMYTNLPPDLHQDLSCRLAIRAAFNTVTSSAVRVHIALLPCECA